MRNIPPLGSDGRMDRRSISIASVGTVRKQGGRHLFAYAEEHSCVQARAIPVGLHWEISQRIRKRVEEIYGWMKTVGGFRRTRYRGSEKTQLAAWLVGAACNLLRRAKLLPLVGAT